jgi:hypothetical protein
MRAIGIKGGTSGGKIRWAKKAFRDLAMSVLEDSPSEQLQETFRTLYPEFQKLVETGANIKIMMLLAQISKALRGDSVAFGIVDKMLGEGALDVGDKLDKLLLSMNKRANEIIDVESESIEISVEEIEQGQNE